MAPKSEEDWQFLAKLMYNAINSIVENILDEDISSALKMASAILNDYEEVVNG
jgi:hypothetical protein